MGREPVAALLVRLREASLSLCPTAGALRLRNDRMLARCRRKWRCAFRGPAPRKCGGQLDSPQWRTASASASGVHGCTAKDESPSCQDSVSRGDPQATGAQHPSWASVSSSRCRLLRSISPNAVSTHRSLKRSILIWRDLSRTCPPPLMGTSHTSAPDTRKRWRQQRASALRLRLLSSPRYRPRASQSRTNVPSTSRFDLFFP